MEGNCTIFEEVEKMGHEQVVYCYDEPTGLKAIIGIHNTVLGPGLGGTRMWNYSSESEAVKDVLRLSRGMTFKNAISGLNAGGGKAVIIGNASTMKSEPFMRRFGRFIDSLGGKYVTAEDVNMTTREMEYISMETDHVTGLPETMGGGGDPSPVTAYGVFVGMKAAMKKVYGSESFKDKKILVQGIGQVGVNLVALLAKEGAKILISDLDQDKLVKVSNEFQVEVIDQNEIFHQQVDVYAPCALGAVLNNDSIPLLKCHIIAGGANNQLENELEHGKMLQQRGIVYAPDFLINAGGVMNVYAEHLGGYNRQNVYRLAEGIYDTLLQVLNKAEAKQITPHEAALKVAMKRISDIGKVHMSY